MASSEPDSEKSAASASSSVETTPQGTHPISAQGPSQKLHEKSQHDKEETDHDEHEHHGDEYDDDDEDDDEEDDGSVDGEKSREQTHHLAAPPSHTSGRTPQLSRATSIIDGGVLGEPSAWVDEDNENGRDVEAGRPAPLSRAASSVRSKTLTIVPRKKRRGLFGSLSLLPEVERPYDYADKTKWAITSIVAFAAMAAPMGSSIFYREYMALSSAYCFSTPPRQPPTFPSLSTCFPWPSFPCSGAPSANSSAAGPST
jgi:hypothetical protein